LAEHVRRLHEAPGRQDLDVVDGGAGVGERGERGFTGEVDGVLVGYRPNLVIEAPMIQASPAMCRSFCAVRVKR